MAGDQMRRARADAARIERGVRGGNQRGIGGEAEVVVAAEGNDALAVDRDVRALRAVEQQAPPLEMIGLQRRQPLLQAGQRSETHNAVRPSESNRCWSRSHSGLPVVSSLSP